MLRLLLSASAVLVCVATAQTVLPQQQLTTPTALQQQTALNTNPALPRTAVSPTTGTLTTTQTPNSVAIQCIMNCSSPSDTSCVQKCVPAGTTAPNPALIQQAQQQMQTCGTACNVQDMNCQENCVNQFIAAIQGTTGTTTTGLTGTTMPTTATQPNPALMSNGMLRNAGVTMASPTVGVVMAGVATVLMSAFVC